MFGLGHRVNHLVFDMDDTLCQTGEYIRTHLTKALVDHHRFDLLEDMENHLLLEGGMTAPPIIRNYTYREVICKERYMLESYPTTLFYHFFILSNHLPKNVSVSICTHRGFSAQGAALTKAWLDKYNRQVKIDTIHCLHSGEHPNKVDYLRSVYGDDFYLVDDNPVYDLSVVHAPLSNVLIYDRYARYQAYQNQKRLTFQSGSYHVEK